ncbi:hypothetical protein [Hydrogenophaga sp.]|uniref:hypothetical protein n=1 Tax=Hydrogenophaga sp. TaxID=1904254 RepID=UPI00271B955E|nr:hypothetical protein [Hydrogenophaga sp.]MDO9437315.1 hypothetical protein [Hydrogenophaga sp.]
MSKLLAALTLLLTLGACAVFTVDPNEIQRGSADGVTFTVPGRPTYDQVWAASLKAMGQGMNVVSSHKPSGTIRSRIGSAPSGKVMALFISPTDPRAAQYRIELVGKSPMGMGQPERHHPEYAVVAQNVQVALEAK